MTTAESMRNDLAKFLVEEHSKEKQIPNVSLDAGINITKIALSAKDSSKNGKVVKLWY